MGQCCPCLKKRQKNYQVQRVAIQTRLVELQNRSKPLPIQPTQALWQLSQSKNVAESLARLKTLRINADLSCSQRQDLQFYIPQLLAVSRKNKELLELALCAGIKNFYFAHRLYFWMVSMFQEDAPVVAQTKAIHQLINSLRFRFCKQILTSALYLATPLRTRSIDEQTLRKQYTYATQLDQARFSEKIKPEEIPLQKYKPFFYQELQSNFDSTPLFLNDLVCICNDLSKQPTNVALVSALKKLNHSLPSAVYLPFTKYRLHMVLKIQAQLSRIFKTKQRCPYLTCVQLYNPAQQNSQDYQSRFQHFCLPNQQKQVYIPQSYSQMSFRRARAVERSWLLQTNRSQMNDSIEQSKQKQFSPPELLTNRLNKIFGESKQEMQARIRPKSIFGKFSSWKLARFMVKTGDDLMQQQFALQLMQVFKSIFSQNDLPLLIQSYEVVSLGKDFGIIQFAEDSITLDHLFKQLRKNFADIQNLAVFFKSFFRADYNKAISNFLHSLVAYSLISYFMQIKDRHNGNIMLKRDGCIFHIDFGFFMQKNPGGAVQKQVPFKLLAEYIQVLGGPDSKNFETFRKLFNKGFRAVKNSKSKILNIVQIMFDSYGGSMKCFNSVNAISQLEARLSPPQIKNDVELAVFCRKLIDRSIDNWRVKLYDNYQYLANGIAN